MLSNMKQLISDSYNAHSRKLPNPFCTYNKLVNRHMNSRFTLVDFFINASRLYPNMISLDIVENLYIEEHKKKNRHTICL